MRNIQLIGLL